MKNIVMFLGAGAAIIVCLCIAALAGVLSWIASTWEWEHSMTRHMVAQVIIGGVLCAAFLYAAVITAIDTIRYFRKEWVQ